MSPLIIDDWIDDTAVFEIVHEARVTFKDVFAFPPNSPFATPSAIGELKNEKLPSDLGTARLRIFVLSTRAARDQQPADY